MIEVDYSGLGWGRVVGIFLVVLGTGCVTGLEDSIEKLGGDADMRAEGRQELLLAKDRAVGPLLKALEEPRYGAGRMELVEVLAGLLNRVEDERIESTLLRYLREDGDYRVRARIARQLGLYKPKKYIEPFLQALEDTSGAVCQQALLALGKVEGELSEQQRQRLRQESRRLMTHPHKGARLEAAIRVENFVHRWIEDARQLALEAQLTEAEVLFEKALEYAPASKRGNYRLARFYLDNGREEQGQALLRRHGMVLDVPRLSRAPELDGRLDEAVWREAAQADSFYQHSSQHYAAIPSPRSTRIYLGYTEEAFFFGFYGYDAHPDSLKGTSRNFDSDVWYGDTVELFIDPGFTHRTYVHVGINCLGTVSDAWVNGGLGERSVSWNADAVAAVYVGDDFWSVEYRLNLGGEEVPLPKSGERWGFNFVRVFRAAEYSQWVRTYRGGHSPDDFGMLLFK